MKFVSKNLWHSESVNILILSYKVDVCLNREKNLVVYTK